MRIFVTGATGFVGYAVVKELLSAGHTVVGLARSDAGVQKLQSQGAESLHGTIEDLEVLRKGASESDGVIHLAFVHDFADFVGSCATDRAAINAMGAALEAAGGNRPLVVTSGTMMVPHGRVGVEDDTPDSTSPMTAARGASESVCLDFAKRGVRASVVRLPPTTHGNGISGFTGLLASIALQKGFVGYVGEGQNRWCAGHRDDAAKVYRLAVEKGEPGSVFHAVAEEGVTIKEIATEVGKCLNLPVRSLSTDEGHEYFGWFAVPATSDNPASSEKTKKELDWVPTGPNLIKNMSTIVDFIKANGNHV